MKILNKILLHTFLIIVNLFCSNIVQCQISLSDILSLENKSETQNQELFLSKGYSIIDQTERWDYRDAVKCNPHEVFDDSCSWKCSSHIYKELFSDVEINLDNVKFKYYKGEELYTSDNFRVGHLVTYLFAKDFNRSTKTATTFIDLVFVEKFDNLNCENDFFYKEKTTRHHIDIQFNDDSEWQSFKNEIHTKAKFKSTFKIYEGSIRVEYNIIPEPFVFNDLGYKKGIRIYYYEDDNNSKVEIEFDALLD